MSSRDNLINHFRSGEYQLVISDFEKVSSLFKNDADILNIIALSYSHLKKYNDAISNFISAYDLTGNIDYKYNLAITYTLANNTELAIETYKYIISENDNHLSSLINLSDLFIKNKNYDSAIKILENKITLHTDSLLINFNYALALSGNRNFYESIKYYKKVLDLEPLNRDALYNSANCYRQLAKFDIAINIYQKLILINSNDYESKFNLGYCYFMIGDCKNGLKLYESREKLANHHRPNIHLQGEPLLCKTKINKHTKILIVYEQGFGDTINFSYFLNELRNMSNNIQVLIQPELYDLFCQSFDCEFHLDINELTHYDYYIFSCSLPLFFSERGHSLQSSQPFLSVSFDKKEEWKSLISERGKRRIGISWKSGNTNLIHRGINHHDFLHSLPDTNDYFCLHKIISSEEAAYIKNQPNIFEFSNQLVDFHETAALCLCMDEIISIDTSIAHLSLGLGVKTTILLAYVPDWRWSFNTERSIWYQDVQIFRQGTLDNWRPTLEKLYNYLK